MPHSRTESWTNFGQSEIRYRREHSSQWSMSHTSITHAAPVADANAPTDKAGSWLTVIFECTLKTFCFRSALQTAKSAWITRCAALRFAQSDTASLSVRALVKAPALRDWLTDGECLTARMFINWICCPKLVLLDLYIARRGLSLLYCRIYSFSLVAWEWQGFCCCWWRKF